MKFSGYKKAKYIVNGKGQISDKGYFSFDGDNNLDVTVKYLELEKNIIIKKDDIMKRKNLLK